MRSFVTFLVTSADGYHDSTEHGYDWHVVDDEFDEYANAQLDAFDALLFGRVTYRDLGGFWPTAPDGPTTRRMNAIEKIVVSSTLDKADWQPGRVVADLDELRELKAGPGGDILVMGSSNLTASLIDAGLLDELRLMVMPIALGGGTSVLHTLAGRVPLTLLDARPFTSGNVLLRYRPGSAR